jgi:hypothetical protein
MVAIDLEESIEASRLGRSQLAFRQGRLVNGQGLQVHSRWRRHRSEVDPGDAVRGSGLDRQRHHQRRAGATDQERVDLIGRRRAREALEGVRTARGDLLRQPLHDLWGHRFQERGGKASGHLFRGERRGFLVEECEHPA